MKQHTLHNTFIEARRNTIGKVHNELVCLLVQQYYVKCAETTVETIHSRHTVAMEQVSDNDVITSTNHFIMTRA